MSVEVNQQKVDLPAYSFFWPCYMMDEVGGCEQSQNRVWSDKQRNSPISHHIIVRGFVRTTGNGGHQPTTNELRGRGTPPPVPGTFLVPTIRGDTINHKIFHLSGALWLRLRPPRDSE